MTEAVTQEEVSSDTPETPATPVNPVKEERISNKLQVLVQREKAALMREQIAKQKEAEFEAKHKAFLEREAKLAEFENLKSTNPMKALELLGLSYQDLTQTALNDGSVPPEVQVRKVEEKFDSYIKAQQLAEQEKAETAQRQAKQQEEKVIGDFKAEITSFINADPKTYELIKFEGLEELIYDTIDENYNRTIDPQTGIGKIMSIKEAADKIEAMLDKKYEDARKLEKFAKQTKAPQVAQAAIAHTQFVERNKAVQPQRTLNTLNNQMSATPAKPRTRPITDDERVQKAIAYARSLRP